MVEGCAHHFQRSCKNLINDSTLPPIHTRYRTAAEGKGKKNKNKRRLPQWAHEELKETAKRVREEHADPEGKGRQPEPQVGESLKFGIVLMARVDQVLRGTPSNAAPSRHQRPAVHREHTD